MFKTTFTKTLYGWRLAQLGWGAAMIVLALLMCALYPTIQENAESFNEAMQNLPADLRSLTGSGSGQFDYSTFKGFLSLEVFGLFLPVLTLAFAITFGAGVIAEEEEKGNFALLLSTQTPRWRIVLEKVLALVAFTALTLAALYAGFVAGTAAFGIDANLGDLALAVFNVAPITLTFAAIAYCITGLGFSRGMALGVAAGLAAITYILNAMANVGDIPSWLQQITPWNYYGGGTPLKQGLAWGDIGVLTAATLILLAIGTFRFQQRDIDT